MSKYLKDPWTVRFKRWLKDKIEEIWTLKVSIWVAQYLWAFTWIWQKIFYPILKRVFKIYKFISSLYIIVWNKLTYKDGKFSRMRGGLMILSTGFFLFLGSLVVVTASQATLYMFTYKEETIYLSNSEEIGEDIHAIKGCMKFPCDEDESVYFRVRSTPFNQVWSVLTRGHLYYPDAVAGVVAPGYNICKSGSYGIRLKLFMRSKNDNWYPDLLYASCSPYNPE